MEFRNLKAGEPVAVGRTEDASEGIYVYPFGFAEEKGEAETFAFRQGRSRETAYSMDYDSIYELLRHETGAWAHPVGDGTGLFLRSPTSRAAFAALVRDGFVHGLMARKRPGHPRPGGGLSGGTALGQDVYTQQAHCQRPL